ncbi:NADH oxidase [Fusobacterium sp. DD29]|uniref:NADH:flavin oxidoreductase n=1 Tax=unclassified Fusobacterium TaxID=2648384 RepID=UPI001B8B560B|nr:MULTISPECIES: NADH:flavin oxidoreductase [unclassified Fusobacterium]MBR8702234.1 NADH oxidase [Fusobacterium sp. DD45]MBR8712052.1 NADH oxidase [Fusobacterium sp. DD28]MBR8750473.1 NADH oxidase [Fusobacterium sp. DD29]MBR8752630.1 NADH oxidase [Fusobacterium sp. DD26]MBR8762714.1 NADH oxidase [Fusobacterium sp. DD25]
MAKLFDSFQIRNIKLKNRIVLPPLVRFSIVGTDGLVTDDLVKWYEDVAEGGVGMIIAEATCVSEDGKLRENQIGIWDDYFIPGLSRIADKCHEYGVPVMIQLHHAGFKDKIKDVPASVLEGILEDFKKAFVRAKKAGFDGIEIHGAHTYLISQLNSRLWNTRDDEFGGDFIRRMNFSKRLIEETRDLFDENFILGYRMGGNEPELEDGIKIAKYLESLGVDLLHVSSGVPNPEYMREEKVDVPADFPLDWVIYMGTEIKKQVNIPVIGVRKIKKEKDASWLIENNLLDLVAVGRAMITRPYWPKLARKEYDRRNGIKNF